MLKSIVYVIAALCLCSCLFVQAIYAQPPAPPQSQSAPESESNFTEHRDLILDLYNKLTQGLYNKSAQKPANDAVGDDLEQEGVKAPTKSPNLVQNNDEPTDIDGPEECSEEGCPKEKGISDGTMFWSEENNTWVAGTEEGQLMLWSEEEQAWVVGTEEGRLMLWSEEEQAWVAGAEEGRLILWSEENDAWVAGTEGGQLMLWSEENNAWVAGTEEGQLMLWSEEKQAWVTGTGEGMMLWNEEEQAWVAGTEEGKVKDISHFDLSIKTLALYSFGYSKDKHPELKQIMTGVVTDRDNLPLFAPAFNGNTADCSFNELTLPLLKTFYDTKF